MQRFDMHQSDYQAGRDLILAKNWHSYPLRLRVRLICAI